MLKREINRRVVEVMADREIFQGVGDFGLAIRSLLPMEFIWAAYPEPADWKEAWTYADENLPSTPPTADEVTDYLMHLHKPLVEAVVEAVGEVRQWGAVVGLHRVPEPRAWTDEEELTAQIQNQRRKMESLAYVVKSMVGGADAQVRMEVGGPVAFVVPVDNEVGFVISGMIQLRGHHGVKALPMLAVGRDGSTGLSGMYSVAVANKIGVVVTWSKPECTELE